MQIPFFYPITLHNGDNTGQLYAGWVDKLPLLTSNINQVSVLSDSEGAYPPGMYVWQGQTWRYILPYQRVAEAIINGDTLEVYYSVVTQATPPSGAEIWRNGLLTDKTTVDPGSGAAWCALYIPTMISSAVKSVNLILPNGNGDVSLGVGDIPGLQNDLDSKGNVKVVNGIIPDSQGSITIEIADVPNLQQALDGAGKVKTVNGTSPDSSGNISLAIPPAYTLPTASPSILGGIKIGSGLNIAGDGTVTVTTYSLPVATASILGGVKQGSGISIAPDGTISNNYALAVASASVLGGVKQGSGINIAGDGTISIASSATGIAAVKSEGTGTSLVDNDGTVGGTAYLKSIDPGANVTITPSGDGKTLTITAIQPSPYTLPVATASVLGGVKQGSGVTIGPDGTLTVAPYSLPIASSSILGGVKIGSGVNVSGDGTISVTPSSYTLPAATASILGGVKIGSGVNVAADGTISVAPGGVTSVNTKSGAVAITPGTNITIDNSGAGIVISSTGGVTEAPADGNIYGRSNSTWVAMPGSASAITAVNGQSGTGAIQLVEANPPANTAVIKSLIQGNNVSLTETGGLITISASLPNGTVASVNAKTPDANGNVTLVAADVSALPLIGGTMQGPINMASFKVFGLPTPTNSSDAVPLSYLNNMTIDGGTYA